MTIDQKLDMIIEKVDSMETRMEGMETRMEGMETSLGGIETKVDNIDNRLGNVESKVLKIELTIENVIIPNINLVAEGHSVLNKKLDEAIKNSSDIEFIKTRVNVLEEDVRRLKTASNL